MVPRNPPTSSEPPIKRFHKLLFKKEQTVGKGMFQEKVITYLGSSEVASVTGSRTLFKGTQFCLTGVVGLPEFKISSILETTICSVVTEKVAFEFIVTSQTHLADDAHIFWI